MPIIPGTTSDPVGLTLSALDYIKQALRMNNVLASGEEPTGNEGNDCLAVLNQQMDAWNAEDLMIFTIQINDFPLTINKQVYTLGAGGDFNIQRPAKIDRVSIIILKNPLNPLEMPIPYYSTQDWQENVPLKSVPSTFPLLVYDDGAFPYRNLNFWPIPQEVDNFRLYSWSPLTYFTDLSTAHTFPPGYPEAIVFSLAARLAANGFGTLNQVAALGVGQAIARIKTMNVSETVLRCDDAVTGKRDSMGGSHNYRTELFGIP